MRHLVEVYSAKVSEDPGTTILNTHVGPGSLRDNIVFAGRPVAVV